MATMIQPSASMVQSAHRRPPPQDSSSTRSMDAPSVTSATPAPRTGSMLVSSFSNLASQAIAQGQYKPAFEYYKLALQEYLEETPSVVELVNAAATCFNLGALSKKLQQYERAAEYFCQAEGLYRTCAEDVLRVSSSSDGQQSTPTASTCDVCLLQLIVETLQARAHLHYKYQQLIDEAIECHEEVIEILEQEQIEPPSSIVHCRINFTLLGQSDRWHLLILSLQSLGKFYVERGEFEDGLMAYQEALNVLKRQESADVPTQQRQEEIAQIVKALSDIYSKTNSESIEVSQMKKLALAQEEGKNWEKALQHWERVLLLQSKDKGEESVEVAETLGHIARVMVAEENLEGALDLYHAAVSTYHKIRVPLPSVMISCVAQTYSRLNLSSDCQEWLEKLLAESETDEEKSWICYELGKLHMEEGRLAEASSALCQSAELSESDDDHVFKLLQKVEFLQNRYEMTITSHQALASILECDETSTLANDSVSRFEEKKTEDAGQNETEQEYPDVSANPDDADVVDDVVDDKSISDDIPDLQGSQNIVTDESGDGETSQEVYEIPAVSTPPKADAQGADSPENDVGSEEIEPLFHNELSRELSPIPTKGYPETSDFLTTPTLDESPFEDDMKIARVVTPSAESNAPPSPNDSQLDNSLHQKQDSASKATDTTGPSTGGSAPDDSPHADMSNDSILADRKALSEPGAAEILSKSEHSALPEDEDASKAHSAGGRMESDYDDKTTGDVDDSKPEIVARSLNLHVAESFCDEGEHKLQLPDEAKATVEEGTSAVDGVASAAPAETTTATATSVVADAVAAIAAASSATAAGSIPPAEDEPSVARKSKGAAPADPSQVSPKTRSTPWTGLLKSEEKLYNNPKSLRIPNLSSPRHPKQRAKREYTDINQTNKVPQRNRFVQALSSPFRRTKNKRQIQPDEMDALDEEREIGPDLPVDAPKQTDESSVRASPDAPVTYIDVEGKDGDDGESLVSQITFQVEEQSAKKNDQDGQWWWGVTAEGLEGWFPTSYVNQAVEVAEGFLSAKSIHDRVKTRPLDFDSDEESEGEGSNSKTSGGPKSANRATSQTTSSRKASVESARPSTGSTSVGAVATTSSDTSKRQTLDSKIHECIHQLENEKAENGPEHISVATMMFTLATLYGKKGEIASAITNVQQALKIQKSTLNLSEACKSLHFMADLHSKEKRYTAALACYSEAQRLQEAIFGYFHEETANTLNRIGNVLARQGNFDLAMENHKEALRILKECFGEEVKNPLVSQTLIQIGAVYYKERNSLATIQSKVDGYSTFIEGGMLEVIGRAHEDRGSYRMAIAFFEEKLQFLNDNEDSDDLEHVAETLNSLGMLSCRAGLYLEAIDYYDRALGFQMKLGCDDVQLAMARVLAGSVQYALGHFKKALKLFQDAVKTLREEVGPDHETVAATLFHTGVVRVALCEYDGAMSDLQEALAVQAELLGREHPATLRTRREIGNLYAVYESELDSAFEEYNDILAAQKRIHGDRHPNVAETLHSIGSAQARKGDFSAALKTLEDCYNMRLEFLGTDHPVQATTLHEIAKIQLKRNRLKKAMHICESALAIQVESLSEHHIDVAAAMATKASCLVARGSFVEANKIFAEALAIAKEAVGSSHPTVASIHVQMGIMHLRKCHFEEAAQAIRTALDVYHRSNLDEDHPGIKEALQDLERVERAEMLCV